MKVCDMCVAGAVRKGGPTYEEVFGANRVMYVHAECAICGHEDACAVVPPVFVDRVNRALGDQRG